MSDDKFADKQVYRVLINAPIERVWSELVNTTSPRPFFFDAICDTSGLAQGAPMRMVSKDRKFAVVVGEVLEFDPPHRYAHTFKFTTMDDAPCKVIYDLKETPDGTEFSLTTENVQAGTKTEKSMTQGGAFITRNIKAFVETGRPTFGGGMILLMIALSAPFSPKSARIENWPLGKVT